MVDGFTPKLNCLQYEMEVSILYWHDTPFLTFCSHNISHKVCNTRETHLVNHWLLIPYIDFPCIWMAMF